MKEYYMEAGKEEKIQSQVETFSILETPGFIQQH